MQAAAALTDRPTQPIVITAFDQRRLQGLIELLRRRSGLDDAHVEELEMEIERAEVVAAEDVPPSVVTMNSTVEIVDDDSQERHEVTVVFPGAADADVGRISVLAPMGAALLGARAGQEVSWTTPSRTRHVTIARVAYQPEAAGHYHL